MKRLADFNSIFACSLLAILACGCAPDNPPQQSMDSAKQKKFDRPYAVGSATRFIHDASRTYDSVGGADVGIRTLITEIWYPVEHEIVTEPSEYRRATYGDYVFGNRDMHRVMMTQTTFFHLTPDTVREGVSQDQIDSAIDVLFSRKRNSYADAPLADSELKFPVVVMSHGDAGSRYNMETVCEYLAAHGYVVIAPEHTGNSPYSMTGSDPALAQGSEFRAQMADVMKLLDEHGAYGSQQGFGQSYTPLSEGVSAVEFVTQLDRSLLQRMNDLRATLRELDAMNAEGLFAGRLDLRRIGLMGRSFGGTSVVVGLNLEDRFTAGMSVVPPGWTDPRANVPAEMLAAAGQESVLLSRDGPFAALTFSKPTLLLSGAEDNLIIGMGAAIAKSDGTSLPSPNNPHPRLRDAYEQSKAPVVWGLLADSNHGSLGVSGDYWWPGLKPDMQNRYFHPEERFKRVAPSTAHQIQQELALAFFDLTIRQDESAKRRLLSNPYADQGLTLESRNF